MYKLYLILLLAILPACAAGLKPADSFGEVHKEFAKRLMWRDYDSAASFMDESCREDFLDKFDERGDIQVLEARPTLVQFEGSDRQRAVTRLDVDYYRLPSNALKTLQVRLEWQYQDKTWQIVSPFPDLP
jgi:hypothetical protein